MPSPFRDSVLELCFLRPKSKFINFYAHFQWKIRGRSWPGVLHFLKFKTIKEKLYGFLQIDYSFLSLMSQTISTNAIIAKAGNDSDGNSGVLIIGVSVKSTSTCWRVITVRVLAGGVWNPSRLTDTS